MARCPQCGGDQGVMLFTSVAPCDRCTNPQKYAVNQAAGLYDVIKNAQDLMAVPRILVHHYSPSAPMPSANLPQARAPVVITFPQRWHTGLAPLNWTRCVARHGGQPDATYYNRPGHVPAPVMRGVPFHTGAPFSGPPRQYTYYFD